MEDELLPGRRYDPPGQPEIYAGYDAAIAEIAASGPGSHVATMLAVSQRVYDAEMARRESINTRAGALLGTAGILGSLVVAAGQVGLVTKKGGFGVASWIVLALFLVSLAYLGAAVVQALWIQGAPQGGLVDPTDLPPDETEQRGDGPYEVRLSAVHLDYVVYNYRLNNKLKYRLLSSQRCLRNGILTIILLGMISPLALRT